MRRLVRFLAAGIFALGASVSVANVAALAIPVGNVAALAIPVIGLLSVSLSVIVWTAGATYITMKLLGDNPFAKDPPN